MTTEQIKKALTKLFNSDIVKEEFPRIKHIDVKKVEEIITTKLEKVYTVYIVLDVEPGEEKLWHEYSYHEFRKLLKYQLMRLLGLHSTLNHIHVDWNEQG